MGVIDKVSFRRLEYEVAVDAHKHGPASKWCEQHFGQRWNALNYRQGRWSMFWMGREDPKKYRFCFANEKEMIWFILKWA